MTTTAKLTLAQQRILEAVGKDWRSTQEVSKIAGIEARLVLGALYTRGYIARRRIVPGQMPLEWRLDDGGDVREVR